MRGYVGYARSGYRSKRFAARCSQGASGCGSRFILPKPPNEYSRPPRCPFCGSTNLQKATEAARVKQRQLRHLRGATCYCAAYWFPHCKGSLDFCEHNPRRKAGIEPTDEELRDYERLLEDAARG